MKDRDAEIIPLIQGLEYYSINSYLELRYELGELLRPFLTSIASYTLPELPQPGSQRTAVIAHGDIDAIDFCVSIAQVVAGYHLKPVILGNVTQRLREMLNQELADYQILDGETETSLTLDETVSAIQTARLGIYRIDAEANPDTFMALGVAIGLNRPGLLIRRSTSSIPIDVAGLQALSFTAYSELTQTFATQYGQRLRRHAE